MMQERSAGEDEHAFMRAVVAGLADREAGRQVPQEEKT